jgi:hypothetical protein
MIASVFALSALNLHLPAPLSRRGRAFTVPKILKSPSAKDLHRYQSITTLPASPEIMALKPAS